MYNYYKREGSSVCPLYRGFSVVSFIWSVPLSEVLLCSILPHLGTLCKLKSSRLARKKKKRGLHSGLLKGFQHVSQCIDHGIVKAQTSRNKYKRKKK